MDFAHCLQIVLALGKYTGIFWGRGFSCEYGGGVCVC